MPNPTIDRLEQELRAAASRIQADLAQKQQMISQLQGQQLAPDDNARLEGLLQLVAALDPNQPTTLADVPANTDGTTPPAATPPAQ